MWESILTFGPRSSRLNFGGTSRLRQPVRMAEALARIERYLSQYDIMRVAFDEKRVEQTFQSQSTIGVFLCDASALPDRERSVKTAQFQLLAEAGFRLDAFDMDEAPLRLGLLHTGGFVTDVQMLMSHLPFDGVVYRLLASPLVDAIEGRSVPVTGQQTEALIRQERSEQGVRRSNAVIDHWVAAATRLPPGRGLMGTTAGSYPVVALRSRAAAIAAQTLTVSTRTSTTSVIVAALTRSMRRHLDPRLSAMLIVSNNRWQPGLREFVGQTLGNSLLVLTRDDDGKDFGPYVGAVHSRAVMAYSHARYDTIRWREILIGLSQRGEATDLSYYFNDVRFKRDAWRGLETRSDELRAGIAHRTSTEVIERRDMSDATLFANLHDAGEECLLTLVCDETRIAPSVAVVVLTAVEALLVEEALAA